MRMRLDKLLANMGYGSRKEVNSIVRAGHVKVNGEIVKLGKTHIHPIKQEITIYGEKVLYKPFIYLMMNKPNGVISATEDQVHPTVIDLLHHEHAAYNPFPIGRLDIDTTGLLLLTNDGKLSHALTSPRREVPKTYEATVFGKVDKNDIDLFREGITLQDGYTTKPAELVVKKSDNISQVELSITEGKYHQVKRMFGAVGKRVRTLRRTKIGKLSLDQTLTEGNYRELTEEEFSLLQQSITNVRS